MSDTPITDAFVLKLERQLGDGPPNISEAAIDVAVRIRILSFAREIERALAGAKREAANAYKGYQACNDDLIKCDAEVMRWFKAASPYATPGSLEEGLKKLEQSLVEAHPECRCHECTAIWERRYPTKNAAPQAETCLCLSFPHACPVHRRDGPIDSTVKPSAWD